MIESITLNNFQSHEKSTLEFVKGVNSIKGVSDSGKSAVLRGLYLLVNNKPTGNSYCRHGSSKTSVSAKFDNFMLTNTRMPTTNEYQLDESVYKALNSKVPSEIEERINMDEINIQEQLDAPFLLSETSGEIAKILNKAVNLDIIDTTTRNINTRQRAINSTLNIDIAKEEEIEDRLKKYDGLEKIGEEIEIIQKEQDSINESKDKAKDLKDKLDRMEVLECRMAPLHGEIKRCEELYVRCEKVLKEEADIEVSRVLLRELTNRIEDIQTRENNLNSIHKKIIESEKIMIKCNIIVAEEEEFKLIQEKLDDLHLKLDKMERLCYTIDGLKLQIEEEEKEFNEIMENSCPLCGK